MYPLVDARKELQGYTSWFGHLQHFGRVISGREDKSLEHCLHLLKQDTDKPQLKAVYHLLKLQAYQEARDYLEGILGRYASKNGEVQLLLARCYFNQGLICEAIGYLNNALKSEPEKSEYLELLADCYLEQGDWRGAVDSLNKAIRANPKNVMTIFRLGTIYSYHGDHTEALRCFQGCCELKPHSAMYWELKGETHLQLEQVSQASVSLEKALRYGVDPDLTARLAYCYVQMNELKKGIRLYRKVLKHVPDHYDTLCNLSAVYQNQGRSLEALNLQERAYTLCTSDPILLNNMAYTMLQLGRSRKATEYYQEALKLAQEHPLILYNLSVCHVQKGNWDAGIETLHKLLKIDNERSEGWALLGNIYEQQANHELAIDCFNKALKLA